MVKGVVKCGSLIPPWRMLEQIFLRLGNRGFFSLWILLGLSFDRGWGCSVGRSGSGSRRLNWRGRNGGDLGEVGEGDGDVRG